MERGDVPREVKDEIVREAYARIEQNEAEGLPTRRILIDIEAWLMAHEVVAEIRPIYGTDLTVRFVDGTQIGILLGRRRVYGSTGRPEKATRKRRRRKSAPTEQCQDDQDSTETPKSEHEEGDTPHDVPTEG